MGNKTNTSSKKEKKKDAAYEKLFNTIKENPGKTILVVIVFLYIASLLSSGINAFISLPKIIEGSMENPFSLNPLLSFKDMFTHVRGYIIIFLLIGLAFYIYRFVIYPRMKIERGKEDDRGFRVLTDEGKYGTAELIYDPEELGDIVDIKPVGETSGVILGKPMSVDTSDIKEDTDVKIKSKIPVISLCSDAEYNQKSKDRNWKIDSIVNNKLNNHIAVFGASGTMKSRALARNLIMQAATRQESIIVTDPKGELYEDCAPMLENLGYDVKMFNLVDQKHSDSWNCLMELLDEDGNIDSTNAKIFADTIVMNAEDKQDYWSDNARNLLKAVCLYVAEEYPEEEKNMGSVYDIISSKTTQEIDILFRSLPETDVARRAYNIFGVCTEQVKGQILNGLGIMLDIFQDDTIRNITTDKEISLSKPVTEKCAYFCITSDQHKVFDFLAVLFYAMLFIKLVNRVDALRHDKNVKTIPVNLVLDEFPNIGQIPDFCKKISTVRSRQINITVIFQNIVQMQNRYPYGQWEEILGNCDATIFLGCTDETTAKYISDKTGIATIEVETQNTKYERDVLVFNQNTSYNEVRSAGQRKVLNPDEVLRIKNTEELIFLRGQKPLKAKKFDYTLHPMSKELVPKAIGDHIPMWLQKQKAAELQKEMLKKQRELEAERAREEELKRIKEEAEQAKRDEQNSISGMFGAASKSNFGLGNISSPPKPKKAE